MPLKQFVCRTEGCYRSFDTVRGRRYHEERGNHDPGAEDG